MKARTSRVSGVAGLVVLLAVLSLAAFSSPAGAELSRAGPVDPETKLPRWFEDETGLRLKPCPIRSGCESSNIGAGERPAERVTYWSAEATVPTNDGGSASLVLSTRGTPPSSEGSVSGSIRISAGSLEPGETYTVRHPYGTETFTNVSGGRRSIDFTEEVGCLQAPCGDFSSALNGRIGPWLVWDTLGAPKGAPPEGYVGDASIPHRVHGSPVIDEVGEPQNYFEIEGPDIGGPGDDTVRTGLFAVEGRISGLTAFASPRSGSYDEDQKVTLTASEPEAEVFYTTDGTEPTADSTPYKEPIPVTERTTLKFVALGPEKPDGERPRSPVLTATYTISDAGSR